MEEDGKLESAFWNLFFNYKKSSASAYMNLRLRPLSRLLVIAYSYSRYGLADSPPLKRITN